MGRVPGQSLALVKSISELAGLDQGTASGNVATDGLVAVFQVPLALAGSGFRPGGITNVHGVYFAALARELAPAEGTAEVGRNRADVVVGELEGPGTALLDLDQDRAVVLAGQHADHAIELLADNSARTGSGGNH